MISVVLVTIGELISLCRETNYYKIWVLSVLSTLFSAYWSAVSWSGLAILRPQSLFSALHCVCHPCDFLGNNDGFSWNCWFQCSVARIHNLQLGEVELRVKFRVPNVSYSRIHVGKAESTWVIFFSENRIG
jgi:hypothetical protein